MAGDVPRRRRRARRVVEGRKSQGRTSSFCSRGVGGKRNSFAYISCYSQPDPQGLAYHKERRKLLFDWIRNEHLPSSSLTKSSLPSSPATPKRVPLLPLFSLLYTPNRLPLPSRSIQLSLPLRLLHLLSLNILQHLLLPQPLQQQRPNLQRVQ